MAFFSLSVLTLICLLPQIDNVTASHKIKEEFCEGHPGRIVRGQFAEYGQFPYQALLKCTEKRTDIYYDCAGSLISSKWILTAAHCLIDIKYCDVKLGIIYRTRNNLAIIMRASRLIMHPRYDGDTHVHDIGLINLPKRVTFTDRIKPIRLPKRSKIYRHLGHACVRVSGWGWTWNDRSSLSEELRYADLIVLTKKEYDEGKPSILFAKGLHKESPCHGDSGGPLTHLEKDRIRTLVGVISYGKGTTCISGSPAAFTRTDYHLEWIRQRTRIPLRLR